MLGNTGHPLRRELLFMCLAGMLMLAGCASAPPDYTTQTKDPWEKLNRVTFAFNQKADKAVARPVAKAYVRAVPIQARHGIHNFFNNLGEPVTIINDLLQGRIRYTLQGHQPLHHQQYRRATGLVRRGPTSGPAGS